MASLLFRFAVALFNSVSDIFDANSAVRELFVGSDVILIEYLVSRPKRRISWDGRRQWL